MELSNATFNRGTVEEMSCLTIHGIELSNAIVRTDDGLGVVQISKPSTKLITS